MDETSLEEKKKSALAEQKKPILGILSFVMVFVPPAFLLILILVAAVFVRDLTLGTMMDSFVTFIGFIIFPIAGIILGILALVRKTRKKGYAIIGIILNGTNLVCSVLCSLLWEELSHITL